MKRQKRLTCLLLVLLVIINLTAVMPAQAATGADIVAAAEKWLGYTYNWNADGGTALDCSGLVQRAFAACGISVPRSTYEQCEAGTHVSKGNLQPGDIVCMSYANGSIGHVGIYVGNDTMIHAPGVGKPIRYGNSISTWTYAQAGCKLEYGRRLTNGTHSHAYTGSHYEAAHPHRVYQKCSCGATRYTGSTTKVSSCAQCTKPGKPAFTHTEAFHDVNVGVTFTWSSTVNTTHNNIYIHKKNSNGDYQGYQKVDYAVSGLHINLPVGEYRVFVQSTNSNASGWPWTNSDDYDFSVGEQYNVKYHYTNGSISFRTRYAATPTIIQEYENYSLTHPDGYRFLGWATRENALNVEYHVGDVYTGRKDLTLYPVWERPNTCGDRVTWTLNQTTGELIIQGSGDMYHYSSGAGFEDNNATPWHIFRSDIKKVTIHDGVTNIGSYAFYGCENLQTVSLPNSIASIDDNSFQYCEALTDIILPDSVTNIGREAFEGCKNLTSIHFPGSIETISMYAFNDCTKLTDITFSDGIKHIGTKAFYKCPGPKSIYIPSSIINIGSVVDFLNAQEYIVDENNMVYSTEDGVLFNKEKTELISYPPKKEDLSYCIPNSVTQLVNFAFYNNSFLTSVTIPNTIKDFCVQHHPTYSTASYGYGLFIGCENLTTAVLQDGITHIGLATFRQCRALTDIVIPDSVTRIEKDAFYQCNSLTNLTLPDNLISIGDHAFYGCNFTNITLPASVTEIGEAVFEGCKNLATITVEKNNAHFVADDGILFTGDKTKLLRYPPKKEGTSYQFPTHVTTIGSGSIDSCLYLKSIFIPDSVATIEDNAFYKCSALQSITISYGVVSIGNYAFGSCSSLLSITIPDSVKSIGYGAFNNCSRLTTVTLSNQLNEIADRTFQGNDALTSITIPGSMTYIGSFAFKYCSALKDIYYDGYKEEWEQIEIDYDNYALERATLHCRQPSAAEEAAWSQLPQITPAFAGKVQIEQQMTDGKVVITLTPIAGSPADYANVRLISVGHTRWKANDNISEITGEVSDTAVTFSMHLPHYEAYRIMLWDEHLVPLTNPIIVSMQ